MCSVYLEPGGNKDPRDVDRLASKTRSLWSRTYVFIKKANIRSWKRVFALAFITGAIAATIWTISLKIISLTHSAGETATLELNASANSVAVDETFDVDIVLNTNLNKVVVAKAVVSYNPQNFQLVSWDTNASTFAAGNTCQYQGKACEIVNNDAAGGKITITVAKPTPGVSSTTATVGTLTFKALQPVTPTARNIEISYTPYSTAQGNYDDSDAVLDDGQGTDILASVSGETITVEAPTCTDFTYSAWGSCQPDSTQSRTVATSSPTGCVGGTPVLSQGCTYVPPTCTSFTYSDWATCQADNTQSRTVTASSPNGCSGGDPLLSRSCTYIPPTCTSFTYSDWTICYANLTTRTIISSSPAGCTGGNPILSQNCDIVQPICTGFTYTDWNVCQPNGTQSRSIETSTPLNCILGNPILSQSCTYDGGPTTCTSFTYSAWGACQIDNTQSRTVTASSPNGCSGGDPLLSRSCTYIPPTCTSFTYSDWGTCQPDNTQYRTVSSYSPPQCTGGTPLTSRSCTYQAPTCMDFTYSDWGTCQADSTQTRTISSSSPSGCTGGNPTLSQSCTYTPETCSSFTYSSWSACQPDNTRSRTVLTSDPSGCIGGSPELKQACTYPGSKDKPGVGKGRDKTKPRFASMPSLLYKNKGDKIWWKATDNEGIDYYTYSFAGKKGKTKRDSFNVPVTTSRGPHLLIIRAYDEAGNMKRKYVTVWVK